MYFGIENKSVSSALAPDVVAKSEFRRLDYNHLEPLRSEKEITKY